MNLTSIKKWLLGTLIAIAALCAISLFAVKSQVAHHNGLNTEVVNTADFAVSSSPLAIVNVSVLTVDCTEMRDSLTVLINKGKIVNVGQSVNVPTGYTTIDGTGQFLIPGFVDTHVHLTGSKNDLLFYLANGVTHISEMFGNADHLKWRKEAEEGALSPHLYVATKKLGSTKGLVPKVRSWFGSQQNYLTPADARNAVQKYKSDGYDAIKLSTFLAPEIYDALVDEAMTLGIPTIGHLPPDVGLKGLYTSKQTQLAHIEEITKSSIYEFGGIGRSNATEYLDYLRATCDSIAIQLKEKNMVVSSTISLIESIPKQNFELNNFLKTIELEYVNPGLLEGSKLSKGWLPGNNHYENIDIKNDKEATALSQNYWDTYVEALHIMTKALIANGVTIVAGTDANATGTVPGFSLHDELASLHKVGMTNSQVLYAATVAPAEWMNSNAGKIKTGYSADMVLLDANPLIDIRNTTAINAVITNGRLLNRELLDTILQAIKDANNISRKTSIESFVD